MKLKLETLIASLGLLSFIILLAAIPIYDFTHDPNRLLNQELYSYEFQTELPPSTTPQELLALEHTLASNGYIRVRFINHYKEGWNSTTFKGIKVYASRHTP